MHTLRPLALYLATIAIGCGNAAVAHPPNLHPPLHGTAVQAEAPSREQQAFQTALNGAKRACASTPANCKGLLAESRGLAADDPNNGDAVAAIEATACVEMNEVDSALAILLNLHDRKLFLCELKQDAVCAQLEAEEMLSVVEGGANRLGPLTRQGAYWQRAHTLRAWAESLGHNNRAAAITYARRARDVFAELATLSNHATDSIKLLDQEAAALGGDCEKALQIARGLPEENLDPQDLYLTSLVYKRCGDSASAERLRQAILKNRSFDLFTAVYRKLAAR
jgi:hypothetical protein